MNKHINRLLLLAGLGAVLTACDENSWNDHLDGFETPDKNTQTETVEYTLTAADYKYLATLSSAKALAGDQGASALAAMGSQGYFTADIPAEDYLPIFLGQPSFKYFSLNEGSAVKVTYAVNYEQGPEVTGAVNAAKYTVSEADYQSIWESDEDFAEAFAPSKQASRYLPNILKNAYPDAKEGDYVIVSYNQAQSDPVFDQTPEEPKFELSSVLGTAASGATVDIKAYVSAVSTQGPVITDASGSIFCYRPTNNSDLKVGDQVSLNTTISGYNSGLQIPQNSTPTVEGTQAVTLPTPKVMTVTEIEERGAIDRNTFVAPIYARFTGVVSAGKYINIKLDGTEVQVSVYGASTTLTSKFTDGATVTVDGYVVSTSLSGGIKFLNVVVTKVGSDQILNLNSAKATSMASRAGVAVTSEKVNAIYTFDGTAWTAPTDMNVLSHADYQSMGQRYDNLSGTSPEQLLPIYLKQKYPYAQADDEIYVVYYYYNGSETVTRCAKAVYNGSEWSGAFNGTTLVTAQYVKRGGRWQYSPDVTITLPAGKSQPLSTLYYQACVDWVKAHVENGDKYVSSYGNNDYYTGASAYQGNVDLRGYKAAEQYPEGYEGMTDEQIVALMKKRFEQEVLPAVLGELHPDAAPTASGVEPQYIINFYYYDGASTLPATVIYKVTAPGTFEYVSCTWND